MERTDRERAEDACRVLERMLELAEMFDRQYSLAYQTACLKWPELKSLWATAYALVKEARARRP